MPPDPDIPRRTLLDSATTPSKPVNGTDTVTIACKIINGIVICSYRWEDFDEPTPSGNTKRVKRAVEVERFVVNGPNNTLPRDIPSPAGIFHSLTSSGGYAL